MGYCCGCSPRSPRGRQQRDEVILLTDNADTARTPRGDSNVPPAVLYKAGLSIQPAPLAGTATEPLLHHRSLNCRMQPAPLAGTATPSQAVTMPVWFGCNPHPSRGRQLNHPLDDRLGVATMQPAPLEGTATEWCSCRTSCSSDAACTLTKTMEKETGSHGFLSLFP